MNEHIINVIFSSENINAERENRRNVFNKSNYQSEFVNTLNRNLQFSLFYKYPNTESVIMNPLQMNGKSDAIRPIGNNNFVDIGNGWNNSHFA